MAVSGSTDWSLTAGDAITRSFRLLRRVPQSESVPGELSTTGLSVLNAYVKSLRNRGVLLSALFEDSFSVVAATATYTLPPRALSVSNVRFRPTGGVDTPLFEESRAGYLDIPNKSASGRPSLFWVDRQLGQTDMSIWPVPATASGSILYTAEAILDDLDATTDDFPINQEFLEPIVWNLAARLAPEFADLSHPNVQYVIAKAGELEMDMLAASRPAFYEFVPDRA